MKENLKVGQILWLKVKYQSDKIANIKHPMLIAKIENDYIEIIAIDKTAGKMHQLYRSCNHYINSQNPCEFVIYEDSYAQLNTKLTIEKFPELVEFRKTSECLSSKKLQELLKHYEEYQNKNILDEARIVHMSKSELLEINLNGAL